MGDIVLTEGDNVLDISLAAIPPSVASLSGTVRDAETGGPIYNVKVAIAGLVTYTAANGYYSFDGLTPGAYTVTFEHADYYTETR